MTPVYFPTARELDFNHNSLFTHRHTHTRGDEEEAHYISLPKRTAIRKHRRNIYTLKMVIATLMLVLIIGAIFMATQRDDIRINILSINRSINITNADVKPKVPLARNVTVKRMAVNNSPRM